MSATRIAFLLAIAGCYSPSYRDCEVTCGGGTCPSGFVCDRGVCRVDGFNGACGAAGDSGIDSDPLADDDGDTIVNANDNCPKVANTQQENEDRDARGDACDPCPVDDGNGADDDDDGDGVGNGCDPEPDQMNKLVVFEGFNAASVPVGWTVSGIWMFGSGQARSNNAANQNGSITWPEPMTASVMVSAQFTIDFIDPAAPQGFAGVAHHVNSPVETRCTLSVAAGANSNLEIARGTTAMRIPTPVMVGETAVTFSPRVDAEYTCGEAIKGLLTVGNFPQGPNVQAGFTELGMNVSLDWIVIVSRAP